MIDTHVPYAVLYLLTFRLAVILLGGVCIYLGFRLFTHALGKGQGGASANTEVSGRFNNMELTLKNAAPGTCFAAFGAAITIGVLAGSPPEFNIAASGESLAGSEDKSTSKLVVRTDDRNTKSPDEIFRAIEDEMDGALNRSRSLARSNPDNAAYKDLQARLEFVHGEYEHAFHAQKDALEFEDNPEYATRLAAYLAIFEGIAGQPEE